MSPWKSVRFEQIADIANGQVNPLQEPYKSYLHLGPENVESNSGRIISELKSAGELGLISGKYFYDENSIVYSKIRPNLNKVCIPKNQGLCSADMYPIKVKEDILLKEYLYHYMLSPTFVKQATLVSFRTGLPKINRDDLNNVIIKFPVSKNEQFRIVTILNDFSNAIETTERLIAAKERYFDGLLQKLLSYLNSKQPEISLQSITIGDILKEFSRKTTINNQHILLSVTKNGIYAQDEHFNKQIASSNNIGYKIIQRDNVVFSTMNLWMGSLDILKRYDVGIVSPAYKTFEINTTLANIDFIQFFLKSPYMLNLYDLYSGQGASIVRRNLDLQGLLASTIKIPSLDHQAKIAEVLNTAKCEIDVLKKLAESYRLQKQGLMQKLLSGEWRVAA